MRRVHNCHKKLTFFLVSRRILRKLKTGPIQDLGEDPEADLGGRVPLFWLVVMRLFAWLQNTSIKNVDQQED